MSVKKLDCEEAARAQDRAAVSLLFFESSLFSGNCIGLSQLKRVIPF